MEEIKHSVELNKVSKWVTNVRITGVVDILLIFSFLCLGQCTKGNRGEHAGLLRTGAIHPEDSG